MSPSITAADPAATAGASPRPASRRLTGLTPSGQLHLGNLLGAIRPMVFAQAHTVPGHNIVTIADLHALTVDHRPHEVRAYTLELATTLLAAGIDPALTVLYVQSQLPEHTELHYLLECVAGHGEAHRMIQFKEKAGREQAAARLSLLTYPVLMAADILLHDTDEVPVGDDQTQHLELTREIATRFNNRYGHTFQLPRAINPPVGARIMDLADPTTKMGKSQRSGKGVIRLLDPPDTIRQKIARAVTDPAAQVSYQPASQPGVANLLEILAAGTGEAPTELADRYGSYRQLKTATTEVVIGLLAPMQRRYTELAREPDQVGELLAQGRDRARGRAAATVARARRALGLLT